MSTFLALGWSSGSLLGSLCLSRGSGELLLHVLLELGDVVGYRKSVGVDGLQKSNLCGVLVFARWQSIVQELSVISVTNLILCWRG